MFFFFYLVQACASHDRKAFKCNIHIWLQPPKVGIIQDLEAIVKDQLIYFYKLTNHKPHLQRQCQRRTVSWIMCQNPRLEGNHPMNLVSASLVTECTVGDKHLPWNFLKRISTVSCSNKFVVQFSSSCPQILLQ